MEKMEISQTLHLIAAGLSLYLFFVFLFWWLLLGRATHIFIVTCILMLGMGINHLGAFILHEKLVQGNRDIYDSFYIARLIILIIPLFLYASYITHRAFFNDFTKYVRRKTDI